METGRRKRGGVERKEEGWVLDDVIMLLYIIINMSHYYSITMRAYEDMIIHLLL